MGQVQNGRLYVRYRRSSQTNEAEELKQLTDFNLCYFSAKSTLKVLLTINKFEKTKLENFDFVHLLSSLPGITQNVYSVCEY